MIDKIKEALAAIAEMNGMKDIVLLIKPSSSLCNLRCRYCFYEDEAENRVFASMGRMRAETAQLLIRRAYDAVDDGGSVSFAFQGGEPTVSGLDFFRGFVRYAREQRPRRVSIQFSIQTNGTLLDEEWAKFLRDEAFLVGISIDGYRDLHNAHRVDAAEKSTWDRVAQAAALLRKYGVQTNALCVVTASCARHPQKAYQSLKALGFHYIQFIGCLDPIGRERGTMPWSLKPEAYGKFLCQLFDLWYLDWKRGEYRSIRLFDDYIHLLLNEGGSTCATCGACGGYFVVEGDGSVYPCDFYVLDPWKAGNVHKHSLEEIRQNENYVRFMEWGREKPEACAGCPWARLCNGGCKNDWVVRDGKPENYYCRAFRMLFEHGSRRMAEIAQAERQARSRLRR